MTTAPAATTTTTTTAPTTTTWQIDPSHSLVEFSVRHMMVSTVKGRFTDVEGTIVTDDVDPSRSSVSATIKSGSISTADDQRDGHLRSPDFFHAEQFPTITFKSTRVEPLSGDRVKIVGDLTIRDTTREIAFDAELNGRAQNPWGKQVVGFSAQTSINRKDFGLAWNVALETGGVLVSDSIKVSLEIEATAQVAA